jgi:hypothetical protein
LEGDFNVVIVLSRIFGFFSEPASCLAFGDGASGAAGSRVRWLYCEPGGSVFEHPDVPMLAAAGVAVNGASVDF